MFVDGRQKGRGIDQDLMNRNFSKSRYERGAAKMEKSCELTDRDKAFTAGTVNVWSVSD